MKTQNTNNISTCLWFDDQAEEATNYYVSIFENAEILGSTPYLVETPSNKPEGSVMTVDFELENQQFTALNGGPYFTPNPSISFFVHCGTEEKLDELWETFSEGGNPLMPLGEYDFNKKYGWMQDKYGLSWQILLAEEEPDQKIVPAFMFVDDNAGKAEDAIHFYTSVFNEAEKKDVFRYGADQKPDEEGTIAYADFELEDQLFAAMDSAQDHDFNFNEAISFMVNCNTQEEIDYYWEKLSAVPESEQCGWVKDRYGVSWQIVPAGINELYRDKDTEKAKRAMEAMLQMKKLDIEALKNA